MITRGQVVAVLLAVVAGLLVYVASGLLASSDSKVPKPRSAPVEQPTPATDAHHEAPEALDVANVPTAAQAAAEGFVQHYMHLTSCVQPSEQLQRLQRLVSEEIYFELVESHPREGGSPCQPAGEQHELSFSRGRGGIWQVVVRISGRAETDAVYFELRSRRKQFIVRYLEDPRLHQGQSSVEDVV